MAEGGDYASMSGDSEEVFESECFNCSQDGKHVEAEVYCVDCKDNLCRNCLNDHNKIARLRAHQIQDKSAVKSGTTQGVAHPPTEKCSQHHGRLIDTFCGSHDVVCCSVCVSTEHKLCLDMKYIPTVAIGISTSKELKDAQATTKSVTTQLHNVKTVRVENLNNVRKQRTEALERTSEIKEQLIECIEELSQKTTDEIRNKYKKLEDAINADLAELNKLISRLEDCQNQLQTTQDNESKLFTHAKQTKQILSAGKKLEESCWRNAGHGCCDFESDKSILNFLKVQTSFGNFRDNLNYSTVHLSDENIHSGSDESTCDIVICNLDAGGYVMADYRNNCLKKLNRSLQIESRCAISGAPYGVCQTSSTEVAVTICFNKKIQFVSVGQTMSLTRSFGTKGDGYCTGIAYRDRQLYVGRSCKSSSSSVQVYDTSGTLLKTIQKDNKGSPMFYQPRDFAMSVLTSNIYVADMNNGVIILDKFGQLVDKINDPDMKCPIGVCTLPGDQLLVCGYSSHNVIQFDAQGRKVRTWFTGTDGLKNPRALCVEPLTFRLIVGMSNNDDIKVFRLLRK